MNNPIKTDVISLFQNPHRFVVPMYQRKYVWTLDGQWRPLWRDVRARAEAALTRPNGSTGSHFLGAVVVQSVDTGIFGLPQYTIIDGQQRLTTLQVLLASIQHAVRDVAPRVHTELSYVTANHQLRDNHPDRARERYKVWPSRFDQAAFIEAMEAKNGDAASLDHVGWLARPRLVEASDFFQLSVSEWLHAPGERPEDRAEALLDAMRRALHIVVIYLDADDDPQVIFETLNDRGVPLRPSDLVRNYVFLQANQEGADVEALFETYWAELDREGPGELGFWSRAEAIGREKHPRVVWFLQHFLESRHAKELSVDGIFDAFKAWWMTRDDLGSEHGLQVLSHHAGLYRSILEPDPSSTVGRFIERINTLQYRTAYPLVLYLLARFGSDDPRLHRILLDLESWLVRRHLARLTTRSYGQSFIALIQQLREVNDDAAADAVRAYLLGSSDDARRWPADTEAKRGWLHKRAYGSLRQSAIKMILTAINERLDTRFNDVTVVKDGLTIEHVLPDKWRTHWPPPHPAIGTEEEPPEDVRDRLKHTFGNLTLLTQALNGGNGNRPFGEKRDLIVRNSALRLNDAFRNLDTWDDSYILARGERLFEHVREIWPRPSSDSSEDERASDVKAAAESRESQLTKLFHSVSGTLLPPLALGKRKSNHFQIRCDDWPDELHYEAMLRGDDLALGIHSEFGKNDPRRDASYELIDTLVPRVEAAFDGNPVVHKVRVGRAAWRQIEALVPIDLSTSEAVDILRTVVEATRDLIDEAVANGFLDAPDDT